MQQQKRKKTNMRWTDSVKEMTAFSLEAIKDRTFEKSLILRDESDLTTHDTHMTLCWSFKSAVLLAELNSCHFLINLVFKYLGSSSA